MTPKALAPRSDGTRSVGVLADCLSIIGPDRPLLAIGVLLASISGILETVLLYLLARVGVSLASGRHRVELSLGPLTRGQWDIPSVVRVALAVVAILLVLAPSLARVFAVIDDRVIVRLRRGLLEAYMRASWAHRAKDREGHLEMIVGEYCYKTESAINQLGTVIVAGCSIVFVSLGAIVTSPVAAVVGGVGLGMLGLAVGPISRRVKASALRWQRINRGFVARVAQTARLAPEVTAFNVGDQVAADLGTEVDAAGRALRSLRASARLAPNLYQYGALTVILIVIGVVSSVSTANLATLSPLLLLTMRALTYLRQLLTATQSSLEFAPYVKAVKDELATLTANRDAGGTVAIGGFSGLRFEDVSFEYVTGHPVLVDVSFEVEPGEIIGLVGPSGGGKTTLTQMMLRLRTPTSGRILAGTSDLAEADRESWSKIASYVPQENKLIYATVADNIRFFRPAYTDREVQAAAIASHLHEEILALPEGYETLIGPGARNLSGGQCQRLGIARALLGQSSLLVLDEPTSALDARSESLIRATLSEIKGTVTVVLIAHRPATLEVCDRVLRVDGHRVVAEAPAPKVVL